MLPSLYHKETLVPFACHFTMYHGVSFFSVLVCSFLSDWFYIFVLLKCIMGCDSLFLIVPSNTGRVSDLTELYKKSLCFLSHHRINALLFFFFILSLSLKEFLPKEYIKQRGAEKRIFQVLEMYRT